MPAQVSRDILHPFVKSFIEKCGGSKYLNAIEIEALVFLVQNLVDEGLWEKCRAIYPFIGRTASTHSINLRNPQKHNIKWFGNVTHNALGATGAGGYGDTLCASGWLEKDNMHISVYNTTMWTAANDSSNLMGVATPRQQITLRNATARYTYSCGDGVYFSGYVVNDPKHIEAYGLIMGVNSQICYVCGERYGVVGANPTSYSIDPMSAEPILLFSEDDFGSVTTKSSTNIRFASIGCGMSDAEAAKFYEIVEGFQTILKRNVGRITLGSTTYATPIDRVAAAMSILRVAVRTGMFTNAFVDGNLTATMDILRITLSGARRAHVDETVLPTVEILSFIES